MPARSAEAKRTNISVRNRLLLASNTKPRGKPKGSGSRTVFDALRGQILSAELPPGADIDEQELVARYGISRTPVREALIKLASEGLVQIVTNRGARVAPLEVSEVPPLLEARELCERAINRWAAVRRTASDLAAIEAACLLFEEASHAGDYNAMASANSDFHAAISRACGNRFIEEHYRTIATQTIRLARMALTTDRSDPPDGRYHETVRQHHRGMVDAIRRGDAEEADRLAKEHAVLFRDHMLKFFETNRAAELDLTSL
ncbi:GntR family transcriptional regulator [Bradyrhizobium sp. UFLA05-109]